MAEEQRKMLAYIVDDNDMISQLLVSMLSTYLGWSFDFRTFGNGAEAYTAIKTQEPDLLITDIQMPEMSGDALLEKLVSEGVQVPTLVISSATADEVGARAMFYSHRMYTPQHADRLNLPMRQSVEEQRKYIRQQVYAQIFKTHELEQAGQENPHVPYDFGVNILTKSFVMQHLLSQVKTILETVYGK